MREILFRGKHIPTGDWVKGSLVIKRTDNSQVNFISNNKVVEEVVIRSIDAEWESFWNEFGRIQCAANCVSVRVDPDTVGQYTDLTDKNGKKIFEGDIIRAVLPETVVCREFVWPLMAVAFHDGAFGVWQSQMEFTPLRSFASRVEFTVVGNIYDNPELMEVRNG